MKLAAADGAPAATASGRGRRWRNTENARAIEATVTSPDPGTNTATITHLDETDSNSANDTASVDANIQLTPPTAVNQVGANDPLTCHVNVNDGTGFTNTPAGTTCTGSIQNGPGSFVGSNQCTTVGTTGDCVLTITASVTGTTTIHASTTISVVGLVLQPATGDGHVGDSSDATKNWVQNAAPTADAGPDQTVPSGAAVALVLSANCLLCSPTFATDRMLEREPGHRPAFAYR